MLPKFSFINCAIDSTTNSFLMDTQIHRVSSKTWKTILIKPEIVFLSVHSIMTVEEFERAIQKPGSHKEIAAFPTSNIITVEFNDYSEKVYISYLNKDNEPREISVRLGYKDRATDFGNNLGARLGLSKLTSVEKKWKRLVSRLIVIFLFVGAAGYMISTIEQSQEFTFGVLGVIAGVLFLLYGAVQRYRIPANKTIFVKEPEGLTDVDAPLKLKVPLYRDR